MKRVEIAKLTDDELNAQYTMCRERIATANGLRQSRNVMFWTRQIDMVVDERNNRRACA